MSKTGDAPSRNIGCNLEADATQRQLQPLARVYVGTLRFERAVGSSVVFGYCSDSVFGCQNGGSDDPAPRVARSQTQAPRNPGSTC